MRFTCVFLISPNFNLPMNSFERAIKRGEVDFFSVKRKTFGIV